EEALVIVRRLRDPFAIGRILVELGNLVVDQGDHARATQLLRESLTLAWEHRFDALAAESLLALTSLAAATGEQERSARLSGVTAAFCQAVGIPIPEIAGDVFVGGELMTHGALRPSAFTAVLTQGQALTPEQAIAEALRERSL
ncbi:MAG: hypothetical protein M3457_01585, partial [Chloroflexota bacterium]|nr:hypothetical protein [Chloroflexota bacterium]